MIKKTKKSVIIRISEGARYRLKLGAVKANMPMTKYVDYLTADLSTVLKK